MRAVLFAICLTALVCRNPIPALAQPAPAVKEKRFPGYNKQRKLFKGLCSGIQQDGHQTLIFTMLSGNIPDAKICAPCASFFRTFAALCKPPKARREAAADAAQEKAEILQHPEPNAYTAKAASDLAVSMAGNDALARPSFEALQILIKLLEQPEGKTGPQQEYCLALAQYMLSPFKVYQGYAALRREFRGMCKELREDGMDIPFYESLPPPRTFSENCMACPPLMRVLGEECKPEPAGQEDGDSVFRPQPDESIEPGESLLDRVSAIFRKISDDPDLVDASVPAADLLASHLRRPPAKHANQAGYLAKLADVVASPFSIYGMVETAAPGLARLCTALDQDRRRGALYDILIKSLPDTRGCPVCRALVKKFTDACKQPPSAAPAARPNTSPAPAAPEAESSASPTPVKEREPNLQVIDAAAEAFSALAADVKQRTACLPAIEFLAQVLSSPAGKSKAQRDYFSTLAEYAKAPFSVEIARKKRKAQKGGNTAEDAEGGKSLDELFDF